MPDDTKQRGGQDRTRIDVSEDYELRDWAKKFGVTPERLQEAIKAVGDQASKVEEQIGPLNWIRPGDGRGARLPADQLATRQRTPGPGRHL